MTDYHGGDGRGGVGRRSSFKLPQEENMSNDFILEGIGDVDISTVEKFRSLK